jgi:hypothetical protein
MQEYDVALKLALQYPAERMLRLLTGGSRWEWLNVELPEVRNRRVDMLGKSPEGALVHIELQSTNDVRMAVRMLKYWAEIYDQLSEAPQQVVLYVGQEPQRMQDTLREGRTQFGYEIVDIRELDGEPLLDSERLGDNVLGILARLRDQREAVRRVLSKITGLGADERGVALSQLIILAGLRRLGGVVEQEAKRMPILNDILDHEVLGREFKKGLAEGVQQGIEQGVRQGIERGVQQEAWHMLRRLIEKRFGTMPMWAAEKLAKRSAGELEELSMRLLDVQSIEELLR